MKSSFVPSAALGIAVLLSGCAADNTPTAYDGQVKTNFIESCTGRAPTAESTTTVLATPDACGCAYDVFSVQVPYNDADRSRISGYSPDAPTFQQLEQELGNDPQKYNDLPDGVRQAVERCSQPNNVGPVAPGSTAPGTTSSAPGTSTSTAPA